MTSDDFSKELHDRSTRGETLSPKEQAQLKSWYALQDEIEDNILGATTSEKTKATMQAQIETTLRQLMVVTGRIQEVASENEALRQEIISLRRQLANLSSVQQAA
jgi:hypothetical protein